MSNQTQRIKHSQRLLRERAAIRKQTKIARAHGAPIAQPHRFAKHHAMDCGQPGCVLCGNRRKIFKETTMQEKSFEQTKKWIEE